MSALAVLAAAAGSAPDLAICADRPGKANATCTVPAGHWQVETGLADWTLTRGDGERETLLALGATAIKYGLGERSHFEIDVTPYLRAIGRTRGVAASASGFGDLAIRFKQRLTADGARVEVAAYPFVKLPTATRPLGNRAAEGGLAVPIEYPIIDSPLSLTLSPEVDWLADDDGRGHHPAMVQAASVGWQAGPKLNLSAEIWGQWNWDPRGTERQVSADGAIAYAASKRVQLDGGANFGLNRATPDVELYAGVSVLF